MVNSRLKRTSLWLLALLAIAGGRELLAQSAWSLVSGSTSPGGVTLPGSFTVSTLLNESGVIFEESLLALNDDYAAIVSPGDAGLLRVFDQDDELEWIRLDGGAAQETGLFFPATGSFDARSVRVHDDALLYLRTDGAAIFFVAEEDDGIPQIANFAWSIGPIDSPDSLMFLNGNGDLFIAGAYNTISSSMAALFLRGGPLESGDPVRLDSTAPGAVVRADGAGPIVGVVTDRAGVALGGAIFDPEVLGREWGPEVLGRFLEDRAALEVELLAENAELRARAERLASPAVFVGSTSLKAEDAEKVVERWEKAVRVFDHQLTGAVLQRFVDRNFVSVAFAGRTEVKVAPDAVGVAVGDPMRVDPVSGLATKGVAPGQTLGVALKRPSAGEPTIEVLLYAGGNGGLATHPQLARDRMGDRLSRMELRLAELERCELRSRLAALEPEVDRRAEAPLAHDVRPVLESGGKR